MTVKKVPLKPIRASTSDYDAIEAGIADLYQKELYAPLLSGFKNKGSTARNLREALASGQVYYESGQFKGHFTSALSKELHAIGARWERGQGSFSLPLGKIPVAVRAEIEQAYLKLREIAHEIKGRIDRLSSHEIAEKLKVETLFDRTLLKIDREFHKTLKGLTVAPKLTDHQRKTITREYTDNLKLSIQGFTEAEIKRLRKRVEVQSLHGYRYQALAQTIEKRYQVSQSKAKFLARQETSLFITKFKETRYQDAGINEYRWQCVAGSPAHPVRPMHKKNDGQIFTWDHPPVVDEQGHRKNPGEDFNCRCVAIPQVRVPS